MDGSGLTQVGAGLVVSLDRICVFVFLQLAMDHYARHETLVGDFGAEGSSLCIFDHSHYHSLLSSCEPEGCSFPNRLV